MIKAILYDLDGVLCDACEWHYISLNKALIQVGAIAISRMDHETIFNGLPTLKKCEMLAKQGRLQEDLIKEVFNLKQKFTKDSILQNSSVDLVKAELHEWSKSQGIKSACITNSISETALLMLNVTDQLKHMEFVTSNEHVKYAKPHGEGYIRAMIRLGYYPNEVVIVEDSDKGIKAAESTGAWVCRVPDSHHVTKVNIEKFIKEIG